MTRGDLQKLSDARMREAKLLLRAGEYSGAYYLAGYAIECALKACYAKGVKRYDFPDKNRATKIFTHKLPELARLANLDAELAIALSNAKFASNWLLACNWTEESRYSIHTKNEAEELIEAIVSRKVGVLPWIRQRW